MTIIGPILAPSSKEYYSDVLCKYNYIFVINRNYYTFNTLATNDHDAYHLLKDFFETFMDYAREWINLNNKYQNIVNKFNCMSKYSDFEKNKILLSSREVQKLDNEIYETHDILSNLLNMYGNIDYLNNNNMLHIVNIIQYIKSINVNEFTQIQYNLLQ